jgi:hypothetical protein
MKSQAFALIANAVTFFRCGIIMPYAVIETAKDYIILGFSTLGHVKSLATTL